MNAPRRLSLAMHAFPRRFRAQRSAEIAATFHEAELAGDRHTYGAAALIDVVFAGWRERARTRPPVGRFLKYRLLDGRLEQRWHSWMFDDLDGWFPVRRVAWASVAILGILAAVQRILGDGIEIPSAVFWLLFLMAIGLGAGLDRRRTLRRHGYDPDTRTWMPPVVAHWVPTPRRINRAAPMLNGSAAALLVVAPFAANTLFFPDRTVQSVTIGSFSFERIVDHTVLVGWAALAVGFVGIIVGLANQRSIATRTLVPDDTMDPTMFVVVPAGPSAWIVPAVILAAGIGTSLLPIAPVAVPAAFLAAGCISPVLLVLAHTARQIEQSKVDGGRSQCSAASRTGSSGIALTGALTHGGLRGS